VILTVNKFDNRIIRGILKENLESPEIKDAAHEKHYMKIEDVTKHQARFMEENNKEKLQLG
jgi:hypothetical protein